VNHDEPRVASRLGEARARLAAMLLLTVRGTPTLYYGDELGMVDAEVPPERAVDPWGRRPELRHLSRDGCRAPMPWSEGPSAGFSSAPPDELWLPLAGTPSAEAQDGDPGSMLALHRRLIALRREHVALRRGALRILRSAPEVLAFERVHGGERVVVALGFGEEPRPRPAGRPLLSTFGDEGSDRLRPFEGVVLAP